jgi:hypothetical protein
MNNILGNLPKACNAILLLSFATLSSYYLRAAYKLGYFPSPSNPDPKDMGFVYHHNSVGILFEISIYAVIVLGSTVITLLFINSDLQIGKMKGAIWIGSIYLLWIMLDPFSLIGWYVD